MTGGNASRKSTRQLQRASKSFINRCGLVFNRTLFVLILFFMLQSVSSCVIFACLVSFIIFFAMINTDGESNCSFHLQNVIALVNHIR